jgi:Flp pilus assembly protein TadD
MNRPAFSSAILAAAGLALACATAADARPKPPAPMNDAAIQAIQAAIDEERYVDASGMLVQAMLSGTNDPRLVFLSGELDLKRGNMADAAQEFRQAEADPGLRPRALEGEGVALSALGRSKPALATLRAAVQANPSAWRAWNALGGEYDARREWAEAEDAYGHALAASDGDALPLNNRGYSRVLQGRFDEAITDLVAALARKPDFAVARNNLRLAMALKGDYARSIEGGEKADQAALLNNAGFAAMTRGDYARAQALLGQAVQARGEYYARAEANLGLARALASRKQGESGAAP